MDEVNAHIRQQSSISSDSIADENSKTRRPEQRLCLVGELANDKDVNLAAQTFGVPIVTLPIPDRDSEYTKYKNGSTVFVLDPFDGNPFYDVLVEDKQQIVGPTALLQLAHQNECLPYNTRALYNIAMRGVVVCFTGFRNKPELQPLVTMIHHMGGSVRKDMSTRITHLIANICKGDKYQYAVTFRVPVVNQSWVLSSWERCKELAFSATKDEFIKNHKLKPFFGARVCFLGFPDLELKDMTLALESNSGTLTTKDDKTCTHVVVDTEKEYPELSTLKTHVVRAEWFWTSIQKDSCLEEQEYLVPGLSDQLLSPIRRESHQASTPGSASRRKRKRLQETISTLALQPSPSIHKRRSSVSDAGLLSVSGSFLDCTTSPDKTLSDLPEVSPVIEAPRKVLTARQQVFLELVQTESNYVSILQTVMTMFKKHLEDMPDEEALLNNTELKIIFGNLPLIYETHLKMLDELRWTCSNWSEDRSIGNIILKYSTDLLKAYPPFVNFFEEMKEMLIQCDATKPRFHAFLKACQTRTECGRQTLQDLLIRPVQRLPSISLLLNDILKNTSKNNADHVALSQALAALKEVMKHINEDKRKTEGQKVMFDIFNEIDNCPPEMVSSHRNFVSRCEVMQMSNCEGLSSRGSFLVLFLFTDQLEVCKKRSKSFNSMKSPNTVNGFHAKSSTKPYKHVKLISLSSIKRVININETDSCQKVFSLVIRNSESVKERLWTFSMTDEEADKAEFLNTFSKQMSTNACTADSGKFVAYLDAQELDIDTSDISNGTFSKAFKFANRTRLKVGRAFSFNKTPSKLKRAVSSMMSPFGSATNITPASQLAQMKLASYSNLSELTDTNDSDDQQPVAPMSVQPTRKMKASSLSTAALKRL